MDGGYNKDVLDTILTVSEDHEKWPNHEILSPTDVLDLDCMGKLKACCAIIIDIGNKAQVKELLLYLRSQKNTCLKPVFLTNPITLTIDSCADAVVENVAQAIELAGSINETISKLTYSLDDLLDKPIFRILIFYYSRSKEINPIKNWKSEDIYSYPLIDLLLGEEKLASNWLFVHNNSGLLVEGELIDRLRLCPKCKLPSPNYVDVCPNCRSINIAQESFLHCFSCGTVRAEKDFKQDINKIECPHCYEKLRHIGTDYDRPLENFTCRDCNSKFSDPFILASCPRCETISELEDLEVRKFYNYQLSEAAVTVVKSGRIDESTSLLDELQNISQPFFMYMLNWLLSMSIRCDKDFFTIIAITTTKLETVEAAIGMVNLMELLEEYVVRIKSQLRSTDFTCRFADNETWIILPHTDIEGKDVVVNKIVNYDEKRDRENSLKKLNIKVSAKTIPTELPGKNYDAEMIVDLINGELERL